MALRPLEMMWERVEAEKEDSDTAYFLSLLYLGELVCKLCIAELVASIRDEETRARYSLEYKLVRASGLGEWPEALDELLSGPAAQFIDADARAETDQLTRKAGPTEWQSAATKELRSAFSVLEIRAPDLPAKPAGRQWLRDFSTLRNKTRGHGAYPSIQLSKACESLHRSLELFCENYHGFKREWAYLHRNVSGKYRVVDLGNGTDLYTKFKQKPDFQLPNGVYVGFTDVNQAQVIFADDAVSDFYLPNGSFKSNSRSFEAISYTSGDKLFVDASPWMTAPGRLSVSETAGDGALRALNNVLTNAPPLPDDYVQRLELQAEVAQAVLATRNNVVTLRGRGGIGKTSCVLWSIYELSNRQEFDVVVWFSARDIDLTLAGPKQVNPDVLDIDGMARSYAAAVSENQMSLTSARQLFEKAVASSKDGRKLFIFDNFETLRAPNEVFTWLYQKVELPNRALVTTRLRNFRGDFPVHVEGMSEDEAHELVDMHAKRLGITNLLNSKYKNELISEAGGHPYVIKILLGEVASAGRLKPIERIMASQDDILTALFERSYSNLAADSQRIFLTLCDWDSSIPLVALEAVILRPGNERIEVSEAVDELEMASMIEIRASQPEGHELIIVPLAARLFGRGKLKASPFHTAVKADREILTLFGASDDRDFVKGIGPRLNRFCTSVSRLIEQNKSKVEDYESILTFLARQHPSLWLTIASMHEDFGGPGAISKAKSCIRAFIEAQDALPPIQREELQSSVRGAWKRLIRLSAQDNDVLSELNAIVALSRLENLEFEDLSKAANRFNRLCHEMSDEDMHREERRALAADLYSRMAERIDEADAIDLSRMAWLAINIGENGLGLEHATDGLKIDPDNLYCQKIVEKFGRAEF